MAKKANLVTLHVRVEPKHKKFFESTSKKHKISIGQAVRNGVDAIISLSK